MKSEHPIPTTLTLLLTLWAPAFVTETALAAPPVNERVVAPGVEQVGQITYSRITESSGIVASRKHPGVFWTHNDGGGIRKQTLYALTRDGRLLAEYLVSGAQIEDWEDIAIDDHGHLFLGDIGNNNARRQQLAVYEIDEPDPMSGGIVRVTRGWQLRFPFAAFDCEALFVWQTNGYVVSKVFDDERARIYRFPLANQSEPLTLEHVARLRVESPVTGADISPDGRLLGLVAKAGAYVFRIAGDPLRAGAQKPYRTKFKHEHIEACCFVPEGLLATAESREIFLFTDKAFHWQRPTLNGQ